MNQLIEFLEAEIHRHDKTMTQFAADLGVSIGYLNNILKGRQQAGTKFFKALSKLTNTPIDYLVALQDADADDPPVDPNEYDPFLTPEVKAEMRKMYLECVPKDRLLLRNMARLMGSDVFDNLD